ncbi:MAG: NUDIX domain-containing protein [Anaerobacillus sp.]|uniref:NUDIX domain-containing protein n=1 Tax=Anaerobacillus sp. TaxID=1872506 RepID=UPI0039199517
MIFHEVIGIQEVKDTRIKYREAVRAVIIQGDKILLVQSNFGDYKFPGGGVEKNENHLEALTREVTEETGYRHVIVGEKVGIVTERMIDEYDKSAVFEMTSHYYLCELVNKEKGSQQLDEYELEQEFTPHWVEFADAITKNKEVIRYSKQRRWIHRENFVLEELVKSFSIR